MPLSDRVQVRRRFLRSVRIDTDLGEASSIDGFVCPRSSAEVLKEMARHFSASNQAAFTWTGPYGSGKSSLAVALSALLTTEQTVRARATQIFGEEVTGEVRSAFGAESKGWRVLPIVGRRDDPIAVIGEGLRRDKLIARKPRDGWNEGKLLDALAKVAASKPDEYAGLVLFVDEMGKFLEAAARGLSDIHVLQQLAEIATRSHGRFVVIGVLHQSFDEYANRLSREMRDEWAKIQGRFVDLAVDATDDEQIDLISRAIDSEDQPDSLETTATEIARLARRSRGDGVKELTRTLADCWPLHPVVSCLLGPISRRRFGQNQRSIFGFLNSSEPRGFQDFLRTADDHDIYSPDRLWDYLRANLEPSILASPDGHRWALAAESLERCESEGGDSLHIALLKTIAVVDLFKERSGLVASSELLRSCFPKLSKKNLAQALTKLDNWSLTIYRKFADAHSIFAGSDFDIDLAVRKALDDIEGVDLARLKSLAGLQPILAKRHYHETGALRWFDMNLVSLSDLKANAAKSGEAKGSIGQFLLAIPTAGESREQAESQCRSAIQTAGHSDALIGLSQRSWALVSLARELFALDTVSSSHPELAGDAVARREISARLATLQALVESELQQAFDGALWFQPGQIPITLKQVQLNLIASKLADEKFSQSARLHSELLARQKPSGNAIAARNALLRRMVLHGAEPRLGIEGYPAEGGLYDSLLGETGLHQWDGEQARFVKPSSDSKSSRLTPMWEVAFKHVRNCASRTVSVAEIYDLWREPPFGVKEGLLPVLAASFILSHQNSLAVYRGGMFSPKFDDIAVDYLSTDPTYIQLRWMDLDEVARHLLSSLAGVVRELDAQNKLVDMEPIDVGRGLISIYDRLPRWTTRTMRLSSNARLIRDLFKRAHDPNQFLFDDIPQTFGEGVSALDEQSLRHIVDKVREGLNELVSTYPLMLQRLRDLLLGELQVPNSSPQSLEELRERAENISQVSGNFRLNAFIGRLCKIDDSDEMFEGIASLAANKPPRDWVDPDLDQASIELASMAQEFLRTEAYARVKGRKDHRHAMAVVVGMNGRPVPEQAEFDVSSSERNAIEALVSQIDELVEGSGTENPRLALAALAELSARYMKSLSRGPEDLNQEVAL
ncbi:MAG: ATP-binding protein [Gammaproteobacteria bacterium]|nr:ATP-binding protein [Gammaproteobacteria bacterium]